MKDSLKSQNSFIFDRCWEIVNPQHLLTINVDKVTDYLKLIIEEHAKLKNPNIDIEQTTLNKLNQNIHGFILKYIQQKQLNSSSKKQLLFVKQSTYAFDLRDCLQIWRWLSEDQYYLKGQQTNLDDQLIVNQFQVGKSSQTFEIKRNVDLSNKNKKTFGELSLDEQQGVMKKSLEMVHMYSGQFKIIFKHYCRFTIQNQHKRTFTFDDVTQSLQILTINRYMLFCRDFDIIKTLQFKKKTQHTSNLDKSLLMNIFKKGAHLQKYMNFQAFLMSLVNIAMKIHQNFDPRSYMHIQLFLNNLKIKYYQQFVKKLKQLNIKYNQSQFYNCYKHIFKKSTIKKKLNPSNTLFHNPYFESSQTNSHRDQQSRVDFVSNLSRYHQLQPAVNNESQIKTYQSVPNLFPINDIKYTAKTGKKQQKRKTSVPLLPSLSQNRYFKPIQHNHHLNTFSKYLQQKVQDSSVFKNRITGYSHINQLKHKPFHLTDNPETVTKNTFNDFVHSTKTKIQNKQTQEQMIKLLLQQQQNNQQLSKSLNNNSTLFNQKIEKPFVFQQKMMPAKFNKSQTISNSQQQLKLPSIVKQIKKQDQNNRGKDGKNKILQTLKVKMDIDQDDELLNHHLIKEKKSDHQVNGRLQLALQQQSLSDEQQ